MITASGSSRLTAEAMPVPSASIARSISSSASWSLASIARSQMPLVRRGLLVLLHQLEEVGLAPFFVLAPRLGFHRRAAGVGLHAALAPAGALGAAALDDHVADLAGGAAAEPGLAVEDEAAADAGAPEDADQALELAPGAEVELGLGRDLDVVADPDLGPQGLLQSLRQREAALPAGQVAGAGDDAGLLVGVAGGADPDALQRRGLDPGLLGRLAQRRRHLVGHVLGAAAGRRRPPRFAADLARRRRRSRSGSSSRPGRCRRAVQPRAQSMRGRSHATDSAHRRRRNVWG